MELIERDRQLEELEERLARARAGTGGVLLVTGEAGVGKTQLVRTALEGGGVSALTAELAQEATEPYAPVATVLRARLRAAPGSLARLGSLERYLSLLLPELGPRPPTDNAATLADALVAAICTFGDDAPAAVFFDDLQWADTATIELLPRLALELESVPVLLVATYRSDEVPRTHPVRRLRLHLRRSGRLDEIDVPALGPGGTRELAARVLGRPVAPSLAAIVHDRTQGVPFFVEELVAVLDAEPLLSRGPDGLDLAAGDPVPLPDTVRDAVLSRVERLAEPARRALELAAVAGQRVELDLLEELGAAEDLADAFGFGLVAEVAPGTAAFRHALVREAVYAEVPWSRRRELHRAAAAVLEARGAPPKLLAEHWLACGERERARAALLAAAERSCAIHAYRDASQALRQALELWPEGEERGRVEALDRLARCAELSGELPEALRLWERIAREAEVEHDPRWGAQVRRSLASGYRLLGRRERAAVVRAEAAGMLAASGAHAEAAETRMILVWDREGGADGDPFAALDAAHEDAERAERPDLVARVRGLRAQMLARRGAFDDAAQHAAAALELARASGVASAIFDAYWYLAAIGMTRADYAGAVEALEDAADYCRVTGRSTDEHLCIACLAKILMKRGDWDRSLALADDVLAVGDAGVNVRWAALWSAGFIAVARGQTDRGRPLLDEVAAIGRRLGFTAAHVDGVHGLALADEIDGELDSAAQRGRELIEAGREHRRDTLHFPPALRWTASFFADRRDAEQVGACVDVLSRIAEHFGSPDAVAAVAHALGEAALVEGDAAQAAAQFERALDVLHEIDAPVESALTKLRAGRAFAAAGERELGVERIAEAYATFRRVGARPLAQRAATVLEELGEPLHVRLGRRAAADLERGGLTRRELEVLRLVAVGRTNREIALELFLSHRTVEMHMRNVLSKLGCRSRTQATTKAIQLGIVQTA